MTRTFTLNTATGVTTFAMTALATLSVALAAPNATLVTPPSPNVAPASQPLAASLADVIPDIAERTVKSVVSITTARNVRMINFDPDMSADPFDGISSTPHAEGSGVILTASGRIVTNAHVLQNADDIKVALSDGREFDATLIGMDVRTDLAVLQLKGNLPKLTPLPVGDSATLRLGEVVLAIGNPFGVGQSVSMGIISAKNRQIGIEGIEDFLQTDAAINPGNSGGALVNLRGELIGINTAIASGTNAGVGFAIPTSLMVPIVEMLIKDGKVTRAYLGVEPMTLSPAMASANQLDVKKGVILRSVVAGGPAARAGLGANDVVVAINNTPISTDRELRRVIGTGKIGSKVQLEVVRAGKGVPQTINATLEVFPEPTGQPGQPGQVAPNKRSPTKRLPMLPKRLLPTPSP